MGNIFYPKIFIKYSSSLLIKEDLWKIYKGFKNEKLHILKGKNKLEQELMFIEYLKQSDVISKGKLTYYHSIMNSYELISRNMLLTFLNLFIPFILTIILFVISFVFTGSFLIGEKIFEIKVQSAEIAEEEKLKTLEEIVKIINTGMFESLEESFYTLIFSLLGAVLVVGALYHFYSTRFPIERMVKSALEQYPSE